VCCLIASCARLPLARGTVERKSHLELPLDFEPTSEAAVHCCDSIGRFHFFGSRCTWGLTMQLSNCVLAAGTATKEGSTGFGTSTKPESASYYSS
jgi:hypothetical protein